MKNSKRAAWLVMVALLVIARTAAGQGTLQVAGKDYKLQHVVAYETKYFDNKAIAVFLCAKPIPMEKLKKALKAGSDDDFTYFEPQVKLTFDQSGKLISVFAWADNSSMSASGSVGAAKVEASFNDGKAHGTVALAKEDSSPKYRFDVTFDTPILKSP